MIVDAKLTAQLTHHHYINNWSSGYDAYHVFKRVRLTAFIGAIPLGTRRHHNPYL